ncbi:hypothetical protein V1527DRAFT_458276 [Lipomyces starkeyi]
MWRQMPYKLQMLAMSYILTTITTIYRQYDLCSKLLHLVLLICSVYSAYLTLMPGTNECRRLDRVRPGSMPPYRTTPFLCFVRLTV